MRWAALLLQLLIAMQDDSSETRWVDLRHLMISHQRSGAELLGVDLLIHFQTFSGAFLASPEKMAV